MILAFLDNIFSIIGIILLFAGTVFIHELGHFLTAKWFGLRIDVFAIGMGPAFWQKKVGDVVYKLCWLPIGGYVALPQMDITGSAFENEDAKAGKLEPVAPWKRIIIAAAGPFMNIVAAFFICLLIWQTGKQPRDDFQEPVVGWIYEDGVAAKAGIIKGDRIKRINGDEVNFWSDVKIAAMLNKKLDLEIERDGKQIEIDQLETISITIGGREIQVLPGLEPEMPPKTGIRIGNFEVGSPAHEEGMEQGDIIIGINGEPSLEYMDLINAVKEAGDKPVEYEILRNGKKKTFTVAAKWVLHFTGKVEPETTPWQTGLLLAEQTELTPKLKKKDPRGIYVINFIKGSPAYPKKVKVGDLITAVDGSPVRSIADYTLEMEKKGDQEVELSLYRNKEIIKIAVPTISGSTLETAEMETELPDGRWMIGVKMDQMYEPIHPPPLRQMRFFSGQIFRTLVAFTRSSEIKQVSGNIGSAVMIFKGMHTELSESLINGLWFTALINVNLAILNLMPIIILDGGHITLALFEWITGKRAPKKLITITANIVVILLMGTMLLLAFKDVFFLVELNAEENKPSISSSPPPTAVPTDEPTP